MIKGKLIIWDFDGVLFDSLRECIIVLQISLKSLKEGKCNFDKATINNICNDNKINDLQSKMRSLRPFVIHGQDYLWQYLNFEKFQINLDSFSSYKTIFDEIYNYQDDKKYEKLFYNSRKILQTVLKEKYYLLFKPYINAIEALKKSLELNNNYICSARDFDAINSLFNFYDINIEKSKIFSKDFNFITGKKFSTKEDQIEKIVKKENSTDSQFFLIEDQLKIPFSLIKKFSKVKIIYAKYGYGLEMESSVLDYKKIMSIEKDDEISKLILN